MLLMLCGNDSRFWLLADMSAEDAGQFGLKAEQIDKIRKVFAGFPVIQSVLIYGSRAKGSFHPGSDIDLTVQGDLSWQDFLQLETRLDDLLLPFKIDLSLFSQIDNTALLDHIKRKGMVFYQHD